MSGRDVLMMELSFPKGKVMEEGNKERDFGEVLGYECGGEKIMILGGRTNH
jgi:hypothetical protein